MQFILLLIVTTYFCIHVCIQFYYFWTGLLQQLVQPLFKWSMLKNYYLPWLIAYDFIAHKPALQILDTAWSNFLTMAWHNQLLPLFEGTTYNHMLHSH